MKTSYNVFDTCIFSQVFTEFNNFENHLEWLRKLIENALVFVYLPPNVDIGDYRREENDNALDGNIIYVHIIKYIVSWQ